MKTIFTKENQKGFTLVEVLVAISVLMISITAPLYIAGQVVKNTRYAQDQLTAAYLAQDAIEYIIAKKNDNIYQKRLDPVANASRTFLSGFDACVNKSGPNRCVISSLDDTYTSGYASSCNINSNTNCDAVYYRTTPGLYIQKTYSFNGYASGRVETKFKRSISITHSDTNNRGHEAQVAVTITWPSGFGTRSITAQTTIYDTPL